MGARRVVRQFGPPSSADSAPSFITAAPAPYGQITTRYTALTDSKSVVTGVPGDATTLGVPSETISRNTGDAPEIPTSLPAPSTYPSSQETTSITSPLPRITLLSHTPLPTLSPTPASVSAPSPRQATLTLKAVAGIVVAAVVLAAVLVALLIYVFRMRRRVSEVNARIAAQGRGRFEKPELECNERRWWRRSRGEKRIYELPARDEVKVRAELEGSRVVISELG